MPGRDAILIHRHGATPVEKEKPTGPSGPIELDAAEASPEAPRRARVGGTLAEASGSCALVVELPVLEPPQSLGVEEVTSEAVGSSTVGRVQAAEVASAVPAEVPSAEPAASAPLALGQAEVEADSDNLPLAVIMTRPPVLDEVSVVCALPSSGGLAPPPGAKMQGKRYLGELDTVRAAWKKASRFVGPPKSSTALALGAARAVVGEPSWSGGEVHLASSSPPSCSSEDIPPMVQSFEDAVEKTLRACLRQLSD